MKYLKLLLPIIFLWLMSSCQNKLIEDSTLPPKVDFKIGKKGIEAELRKTLDFQKISFGTYYTTKQLLAEEKGITLTFQLNNLESVSDSLIGVFVKTSEQLVKEHLLHLKDYDFVKLTFNTDQTEGEFKKTTSVEIKKPLK